MPVANLSRTLLDAVQELRDAQDELASTSKDFAACERAYRLHKAMAFVSSIGSSATEREAKAETVTYQDRTLSDARYARDLARGLRESALEKVRSTRQTVSAIQSLAALEKSEAELAKWGPQ